MGIYMLKKIELKLNRDNEPYTFSVIEFDEFFESLGHIVCRNIAYHEVFRRYIFNRLIIFDANLSMGRFESNLVDIVMNGVLDDYVWSDE